MKTALIRILGCMGTIGLMYCSAEEVPTREECVIQSQNQNWTTEDFKGNFTIQFPIRYEGSGMIGFEGNTFNKKRTDGKVELGYGFCTGTFCADFGSALDVPAPTEVMAKDKGGNDVLLTSKMVFCSGDGVMGHFYFNRKVNSTGKYYIRQGTDFLEGMTVFFEAGEYPEVENIIRTIAAK